MPPLNCPRMSCTRCTLTPAVLRGCLLPTRSVSVCLLVCLSLLIGLLIANQVCLCLVPRARTLPLLRFPAPSLPSSSSLLTGLSLLRGRDGQVRSYCDSINNFSGQSLTKLYAVKGLQDKSP